MIKAFLLLTCFVITSNTFTQETRTPIEPSERFSREAQKVDAYKNFKVKLDRLVTESRGSMLNIEAVEALYSQNQTLLQSLYKNAGLPKPRALPTVRKAKYTAIQAQPNAPISSSIKYKLARASSESVPPFDRIWQRTNFPNANMSPLPFDTSQSLFGQGKLVLTSNPCNSHSYCYLGLYAIGYVDTIRVPNNPKILAAKITFQYSLDYDAWDSYGARVGIDLLLNAPKNFNSAAYNQLPPTNGNIYFSNTPWKKLGVLLPVDSVTTDFDEFHATANASYSIEGYVTPGSKMPFLFGLMFPAGTNKGLTGCYHHGVFKLKKISVSYYTAVN